MSYTIGFNDYSEGKYNGVGSGEISNAYLPGGNFIGVFDGNDDYVEIKSLENLKDMSIQFWIKTQEMQNVWGDYDKYGVQQIVSKEDKETSEFSISIIAEDIENSKWDINYKDSNCNLPFSNSNIPADNKWHNIGVSRGGDKTVMVYVDGVLKEQKKCSNYFNSGNGNLYIGVHNSESKENMFNGLIDDLLIYNRQLPSNQMRTNYAAFRANFENEDANAYSNSINDWGEPLSETECGEPTFLRTSKKIGLEWDPSPDASVVGYKIYREWRYFNEAGEIIESEHPKEVIATVSKDETSVSDIDIMMGPNWFTATAYTAEGKESLESNTVLVIGVYSIGGTSIDSGKTINMGVTVNKNYQSAGNSFVVQSSEDMINWVTVPSRRVAVDYKEIENGLIFKTYKVTIERGVSKCFFRLKGSF